MSRVYALAHHADYGCRHTGACCTAGWRIPVEPAPLARLRRAASDGRVPRGAARTETDGRLTVLALAQDGACTAYEPPAGGAHGRCVVHHALGESALPSACRHFPRVSVTDARGTHVTLSHFCPTAASTLFRTDVPLAIVADPAMAPAGVEYEGLDAREALPPLLHPTMLMDLEGYAAWERHLIDLLASGTCGPAASVARLARDAAVLSSWTPSQGSLREAVERLDAPARSEPAGAAERTFRASVRKRYAAVITAVPPALRPAPLPPLWAAHAATLVDPMWDAQAEPLRRYLAGRAFASWVAWHAGGLADVVESLGMALAVVYAEAARGCRTAGRELDQVLLLEAVRRADDLLVHRASPALLARAACASLTPGNASFG